MVNYVRVSVTDRCNLHCIYCRWYEKFELVPCNEILRFEELRKIIKMLNQKGIQYVRITGGEPLERKNIKTLVRMLKGLGSLKEITMTTNGVHLADRLPELVKAGLNRINLSLNTFRRKRYQQLTGEDRFRQVWTSIKEILSLPDFPLKINTIIFEGINDDEIEDFVKFSINNRINVRFIEYFPTPHSRPGLKFVPNFLIKKEIEKKFGMLIPDEIPGNGPALNYKISQAQGGLSFININTGNFCPTCNRLRLTAEGRLYPCLFSPYSINLKQMLRNGYNQDEISLRIDEVISKKWTYSKKNSDQYEFTMSKMGG